MDVFALPEKYNMAVTESDPDAKVRNFLSITFYYTRRQINQDRMIFGDFSVNSKPIFFKFCKGHFLFKS